MRACFKRNGEGLRDGGAGGKPGAHTPCAHIGSAPLISPQLNLARRAWCAQDFSQKKHTASKQKEARASATTCRMRPCRVRAGSAPRLTRDARWQNCVAAECVTARREPGVWCVVRRGAAEGRVSSVCSALVCHVFWVSCVRVSVGSDDVPVDTDRLQSCHVV